MNRVFAPLALALVAASASAQSFGTSALSTVYESRPNGNGVVPGGYEQIYENNPMGDYASAYVGIAKASGTAYADLGGGKMGVSASAVGHTEARTLTFAGSTAEMWDLVTIFRNDSPATRIPLQLDIDGSAAGNAALHVTTWVDDATSQYKVITEPLYSIEDSLLAPLTSSFTFKYKIRMEAYAAANRNGSDFGIADYANTLHLKWDLPAGMTYTSSSGVFNPAPITQAVPEPTSITAVSIGVLGVLKRRRRA